MSRVQLANAREQFTLLHNPYQQAFLQALDLRTPVGRHAFHRYALISGRRGGKTVIGGVAAVKKAAEPNTLGWCVAPTYGDLHRYVIPAVFKVLPRSWLRPGRHGWSESKYEAYLINGSTIAFLSAEDEERMRGVGLDWLWLDEARAIRPKVWDTVRPALSDKLGICWATTSPNGFDWVYNTFYRPALDGPRHRPGYWAVRYKTIDNPLFHTDPAYREEIDDARATSDPEWFAQEYEAEFVNFQGAIYAGKFEKLVWRDEEVKQWIPTWPNIPSDWPIIVGLDPGADHPFAAVKIVATPQGLVVIDEYCKRMTSFLEHGARLQQWRAGHGDIRWGIDRSAVQAQIEFAQMGITASAAENNVQAGIQRTLSWMHTKGIRFVGTRVPMLLEEMSSYRWRDNVAPGTGEKRKEEPYKKDDDLVDAMRYALMTWPQLPEARIQVIERQGRVVPEESRWAWEREQRLQRAEQDVIDWSRDLSPIDQMFTSIHELEYA